MIMSILMCPSDDGKKLKSKQKKKKITFYTKTIFQ